MGKWTNKNQGWLGGRKWEKRNCPVLRKLSSPRSDLSSRCISTNPVTHCIFLIFYGGNCIWSPVIDGRKSFTFRKDSLLRIRGRCMQVMSILNMKMSTNSRYHHQIFGVVLNMYPSKTSYDKFSNAGCSGELYIIQSRQCRPPLRKDLDNLPPISINRSWCQWNSNTY